MWGTILRSRARLFGVALALGCATATYPPARGVVSAATRADGWTQFTVDGDLVRIYRDDFGVPHVFAETNRALFAGFGYTVAEDRLWQLELFRRAAYGQLAEILGASASVSDLAIGTPNAL